jgi:hypothetical protein
MSVQTISPAASMARTMPVTHMIVSFNSTSLLLPQRYAQRSTKRQPQNAAAHVSETSSLGQARRHGERKQQRKPSRWKKASQRNYGWRGDSNRGWCRRRPLFSYRRSRVDCRGCRLGSRSGCSDGGSIQRVTRPYRLRYGRVGLVGQGLASIQARTVLTRSVLHVDAPGSSSQACANASV